MWQKPPGMIKHKTIKKSSPGGSLWQKPPGMSI